MSDVSRRLLGAVLSILVLTPFALAKEPACGPNDPYAEVVALDQPYWVNRLGAQMPQGIVYALRRDVVPKNCYGANGQNCQANGAMPALAPGYVMLRYGKRPRPFVLRVNEGQCLRISLYNALPNPQLVIPPSAFPVTNDVSIHVNGLELVGNIGSDGSFVGANSSSLVAPGKTIEYKLYAAHEGVYLLYSMGSDFNAIGGGAQMGQANNGLFGSVIVEPKGAEDYRSQVTREELLTYGAKHSGGKVELTPLGQPLINYDARYPASDPYMPCFPVFHMEAAPMKVSGGKCVGDPGAGNVYYSDLTAIITGPKRGNFTAESPSFEPNPAEPGRREPFREFVIHYHELITAVQPFNDFYKSLGNVYGTAADEFAINFGSNGITNETVANRLGVGPEKDCTDCKFEEFFLSSWTVGDPAQVTDWPADTSKLHPPPAVLYGDDPSNVYHSYMNDHVKFRILHAGGNLTHIHHQHAHQWLHSPNNDNSSYLDSQLISPGSAYTLDIDYNGSGNRNRTLGDSIFHCHFYPHFAAGMWALWRVHDVFEMGTELQKYIAGPENISAAVPVKYSRAQPDGELTTGTPIPAIVPIPTLPMAPLPGYAHVDSTGKEVQYQGTCQNNKVDGMPAMTLNGMPATCTNNATVFGTPIANGGFHITKAQTNPGYPFFIPGRGGSRAPHPPLDFACELDVNGNCKMAKGKPVLLDGGLPRHLVTKGTVKNEQHNAWDLSKDNDTLTAIEMPEDGTPTEKVTMAYTSTFNHPSFTPSGAPGVFHLNGGTPKHGAPFADPAIGLDGQPVDPNAKVIRYQAANVQTDVVFNKKGWHYPQQRFLALWGDVKKTLDSPTLVQPFFFRANSREHIIEYWLANLVPSYYELDDFQVRTPTDILGQHIHLVKFDVLASDGAANGYNYEDGTFAYDEVTERIDAINKNGGLWNFDQTHQTQLVAKGIPEFDAAFGPKFFLGAQATIQRWYPDPLLNNEHQDRTLRTVFTHDHFGPSTHQQAGLYAGLLVEPEGSKWTMQDGTPMHTRSDGGPTSWEARIITHDDTIKKCPTGNDCDYREFALEFGDLALTYTKDSPKEQTCYPIADSIFGHPTLAHPCKPYPGGTYSPNNQTITTTTLPWGWASATNSGTAAAATAVNPSNGKGKLLTNPTVITGSVFVGTMNVNYRDEPIPFRISSAAPATDKHDPSNKQTDLAYAFNSIKRIDPDLNKQPTGFINGSSGFFYPVPFADALDEDPYTPLLRAYQGDKVMVRVLVGSYLFNHNFGVHGLRWLFEPSATNSGWRDNQPMGISEHFEFLTRMPNTAKTANIEMQPCAKGASPSTFCADYLYMPGTGQWDLTQGLWGLIRSYNLGGGAALKDLKVLPNNAAGGGKSAGVCPPASHKRSYDVTAVTVRPITYNDRVPSTTMPAIINGVPVLTTADIGGAPDILRWKVTGASDPNDPAVLRANAGDCVSVTLHNNVNAKDSDGNLFRIWLTPDLLVGTLGNPFTNTGGTQISSYYYPSWNVGMHAQLLEADPTHSMGLNVGINPDQVVPPAGQKTYTWWAGADQTFESTKPEAIEFGTSTLIPSDQLEHASWAMVGAFVTEPHGSTWPSGATVMAVVKPPSGTPFREFVNVLQNNLYLATYGFQNNGGYTYNAMNNFSEAMNYRYNKSQIKTGTPPPTGASVDNNVNIFAAYSNTLPVPGTNPPEQWGDPGPIFTALPGEKVRFRLVHPDGIGGFPDDVIKIHGHGWAEEPYSKGSTSLGANSQSNWFGVRDGFGPQNHFDILLNAGASFSIKGDYLLASHPGAEQLMGNWAIFRVCDPGKETCTHRAPRTTTPMAPATAKAPTETAQPATAASSEKATGRPDDINRFALHSRGEAPPAEAKPNTPPPQP